MSDRSMFAAPVIEPIPEHYDEVVERVVTIDALPGGFGQKAQKLSEPIESIHFKRVEIPPDAPKVELPPVKLVTAAEAKRLIESGTFHKSIIPRKLHCRECDADLPPERGLYCRSCRPSLDEDPGQYLYCGASGE